MIYRAIIDSLRSWAGSSDRKPLVIRGAREVGKTTIVKQFATEFDTFLYLNLELRPEKKMFDRCLSTEDVLNAVYMLRNKEKSDGRVLLFIDEIQYSPKAVAMLHSFHDDMPDLYVIAASSLHETLIDKNASFAADGLEYLALHPCSFSEFLKAMGETYLQDALLKAELPTDSHSRVMKLFNEYALVGGMPEAVDMYASRRDLVALRKIYNAILNCYRNDVEKHARSKNERGVLRHILTDGWRYAGQRINFTGFADSDYKCIEMGRAFHLLEKAMLLELVYPTVLSGLPVSPDNKRMPKLLYLDTGLVNQVARLQNKLCSIQDISEIYDGKVAEHIVSQLLISHDTSVLSGHSFWVKGEGLHAEVDYVIGMDGFLLPIEIKSGDNSRLKSIQSFMNQSKSTVAIRFWNNPLSRDIITLPSGKQYTLINAPFYYAECLRQLITKS